ALPDGAVEADTALIGALARFELLGRDRALDLAVEAEPGAFAQSERASDGFDAFETQGIANGEFVEIRVARMENRVLEIHRAVHVGVTELATTEFHVPVAFDLFVGVELGVR